MRSRTVVKAVILVVFLFIVLPALTAVYLFLDIGENGSGFFTKTMEIEAGSYNGRVTEEGTGKPIEGAAVYALWHSRRRTNILERIWSIDRYVDDVLVGESLEYTDKNGEYRLPAAAITKKVHWRMKRPTVIMGIYKPFYIGYRSDMIFMDDKFIEPTNEESHFQSKSNEVILRKQDREFRRMVEYLTGYEMSNPNSALYRKYRDLIIGRKTE